MSQPRLWATPLYSAIESYRQMLTMTESSLDIELHLTPQDKLAENCPRCFGPPINSGLIAHEPDIIVCLDGNFQHRRHLAAGQKARLNHLVMPTLFLSEEKVNSMKTRIEGKDEKDFVGHSWSFLSTGILNLWMLTQWPCSNHVQISILRLTTLAGKDIGGGVR